MKTKAVFYHAGCPVCREAEQAVQALINPATHEIEVVHLGEQPSRLGEAEKAGVVSVPALVVKGTTLHLNHGADLSALRPATA